MKARLLRAFARPLAIAVVLALAVGSDPAAAQVADEAAFRSFVEGVQNGTLPPALAERECQRELAGQEETDNVRQMMAGYLDVPEREALATFCASLVRAARAGEVTLETAGTLGRHQMDADFFQAFGRVLRAVHFAHDLTPGESVAETPRQ